MCTVPVHNNSHLNVFYIVTLTGRNKRTGKKRRKEDDREMTNNKRNKTQRGEERNGHNTQDQTHVSLGSENWRTFPLLTFCIATLKKFS